jgi:hypothetical protein
VNAGTSELTAVRRDREKPRKPCHYKIPGPEDAALMTGLQRLSLPSAAVEKIVLKHSLPPACLTGV